jgi:hypothetical protein
MGVRAGAPLLGQARKFFAGARETLIRYAAHQRKLGQPQTDGRPLRAHLAVAARHDPAARIELAGPELPSELAYAWGWFLELSRGRKAGHPLPWREIESWARVTRRMVKTWEVDLLRDLDSVWLYGLADDAIRRDA